MDSAAADNIELEAAEALAGLATTSYSSIFPNSTSYHQQQQEATNYKITEKRKSELTANDEQSKCSKTVINPTSYPTGRKSRLNLTEAEMEARKIRRVLANRESARQTIRRRQAIFEELTRKAVDLTWENQNLKKEKETASKQYDSLKTKNRCLKAQVAKIIHNEGEEARKESITNEPAISTSSTNSPFIIYKQPSFIPFVWPSSVQSGIGFFANPNSRNCNSSSCEEGSSIYLLPYPCLVTLPHENDPHSFNLNDKPKESIECQQFFPEKSISETPTYNGFPPDGGGRDQSTDPVSCEELLTKVGDNKIHQVPVVCSGKRLGDTAAATEARKRRKQLTRLKNHFHCRQLRTLRE